MELTKEKITELIRENWDKISNFGVETIWLFGSYAYDKQEKDSDIDFLIEYKEGRGKSADDHFGLSYFLENLFKKEVDIGERNLLKEGYKENILGGILVKC